MNKHKLALSVFTGVLLLSNQSFAFEENCFTKMSYQIDIAQCQYEIYPDPETEVAIPYTKTFEDQSYCRTLDEYRITKYTHFNRYEILMPTYVWYVVDNDSIYVPPAVVQYLSDIKEDAWWTQWIAATSRYFTGQLTNSNISQETRHQYIPIQCPGGPGNH